MTHPSTRILVLGAGIAGLLFTLRLAGKVARESVQITLIDESDTFTVRPRLQEFATNQRIFSRPFLEILRKTQVQFLEARVTSLNPSQHRITIQVEPQMAVKMMNGTVTERSRSAGARSIGSSPWARSRGFIVSTATRQAGAAANQKPLPVR